MAKPLLSPVKRLRKHALTIVIVLSIQYLLGILANLFVSFPDSGGAAHYWEFARTQIVVILHMIVGFGLLAHSVALLVRSVISKNRLWKIVSSVGLIAILTSVIGGITFVSSQSDIYSFTMAFGFIIAMLSYVLGLYLSV